MDSQECSLPRRATLGQELLVEASLKRGLSILTRKTRPVALRGLFPSAGIPFLAQALRENETKSNKQPSHEPFFVWRL